MSFPHRAPGTRRPAGPPSSLQREPACSLHTCRNNFPQVPPPREEPLRHRQVGLGRALLEARPGRSGHSEHSPGPSHCQCARSSAGAAPAGPSRGQSAGRYPVPPATLHTEGGSQPPTKNRHLVSLLGQSPQDTV